MVRGLDGSTVVAFKYKAGVIVATDTAVSYGGLAMPNITRIFKLTENCVVAFSGQYSDIQFLHKAVANEIEDDPRPINPQGIHKLIQRILYRKRSELKFLNVSVVVCGMNKKEESMFKNTDETGRMVGVVNSKGNFWFEESVATGIASHLILPVLREHGTENLSKEEAIELMEKCLRILCYKDCRASNIVQLAFCESNGIVIGDPYPLSTNWELGVREDETILQ